MMIFLVFILDCIFLRIWNSEPLHKLGLVFTLAGGQQKVEATLNPNMLCLEVVSLAQFWNDEAKKAMLVKGYSCEF